VYHCNDPIAGLSTMAANNEHARVMNTLEAGPTSHQPPPRASFMGLPVEVRLEIYGYLLTPTLTTSDVVNLRATAHCCFSRYLSVRTRSGNAYLRCECRGTHTSPQILRASKQIFSEAMPVLYANMELLVPLIGDFDITGRSAHLDHVQRNDLPSYALPHISRVRIVGSRWVAATRHEGKSKQWPSNIGSCRKVLGEQLPELAHLSLHLEGADHDGHFYELPFSAPFEDMRSVNVHLHGQRGGLSERLQREIVKELKNVAGWMDKMLELTEE